MSNLTKIVESEIENLSEKDRKLLKDKLKKQEESFTNKVSEIIGEEYDKLKEGRPVPMVTPDEIAYKDFKKWAHSKRSKIKKQMQSLKGDGSKIFRAMGLVWQTWAKATDNKEFERLRDPSKFGRALVVMMVKDNLVFDKKAWGKDNKIIHIKEDKLVEGRGSYTIEATLKDIQNAKVGAKASGGGYSPFTKLSNNSWKNIKTGRLVHDKALLSRLGGFDDFVIEGKLTEATLRKGDLVGVDDEIGVVNKVKGRVAYIKLPSSPGSFHPIEALRAKYKGKFKGKDLYIAEGKLNESVSDKEVFAYLRDLRDSGKTNMFGAAAYIERDFGLDSRKAKELLAKWMKSFNESKLTEVNAKYWVEVAVRNARVANNLMADSFRNKYKNDGSNVFTFKKEDDALDAMEVFEEQKIEILATSYNLDNFIWNENINERKLPKRFTVINKFRVDGQVFNTGDYANKKERMGKTMVLNMDNSEMLSIDYQDYTAAVKNKHITEGRLTEAAEKYITNKWKVGDEIYFFGAYWYVAKVNFKPGKSYKDSFTFVDGKQVSIKAPPTNKNAVGYKIEDGKDSAFLHYYKAGSGKTITKLASKGFNESVSEGRLNEMDINDPILVAIRARKTMLAKEKSAPKVKKLSTAQYYKLMDLESDLISKSKDVAKEFDQMNSDMLQDAGQKGDDWSDADANKWGIGLDKLQTKVEKLNADRKKVKKAIMNYRMS